MNSIIRSARSFSCIFKRLGSSIRHLHVLEMLYAICYSVPVLPYMLGVVNGRAESFRLWSRVSVQGTVRGL